MKSKSLLVVLVIVGIAIIVLLARHRSEKSAQTATSVVPGAEAPPSETGLAATRKAEEAEAAKAAAEQAAAAAEEQEIKVAIEKLGPADSNTVIIAINEVLATVNGAQVTLRDLVPVRKGQGAQKMDRDDYERRLNKGINQLIVEQQAKAQGVVLTSDQQSNANSIRTRLKQDVEYHRSKGELWTSVSDEQAEFEVRHVADLLLLQNLVKELCPPLIPGEADIQKYYDENKAKYGDLPEDAAQRETMWQQISADITSVLMPVFQEAYVKCQDDYLAGQKDKSNVVIVKPSR